MLIEDASGRFVVGKVLTTPDNPAAGVRGALEAALRASGIAAADVGTVVHGTTLVTNALIERKGAPTALLVTQGFRDVLLIGREHRHDMYDVRLEKPPPLVPRHLTFRCPSGCWPTGRSIDPWTKRLCCGSPPVCGRSVLNCRHPAPTAARHLLGHFLPGMVLAALAPVVPERAMAEGMAGLWSTNVYGQDPAGGRSTLLSFLSGGTGARRDQDGLSSTAFPSGVAGIPTEVFENRCPLVLLERELRQDSGGPGRQRGGLGHRLVYSGLRLSEPYRLSPFTDRVRYPAPGLEGGLPGAAGQFDLADGTQLHPKRTAILGPDQRLVVGLPGGGGFGSPLERDPELVRRDVLDELVSPQQARESYGVVLREDGTVDRAETRRLRTGRGSVADAQRSSRV